MGNEEERVQRDGRTDEEVHGLRDGIAWSHEEEGETETGEGIHRGTGRRTSVNPIPHEIRAKEPSDH